MEEKSAECLEGLCLFFQEFLQSIYVFSELTFPKAVCKRTFHGNLKASVYLLLSIREQHLFIIPAFTVNVSLCTKVLLNSLFRF